MQRLSSKRTASSIISRTASQHKDPRSLTGASFVQNCPEPSCECLTVPELDIDRKSSLKHTTPYHRRHIIVNTEERPWPSRFEDDSHSYAAKVKAAYGKNGALFDPRNTPLVSAVKFPPETSKAGQVQRLLIFPDFVSISTVSTAEWKDGRASSNHVDTLSEFASQRQIDDLLFALHSRFSWPNEAISRNSYSVESSKVLPPLRQLEQPMILICGHGSRDERCGVLGPLLQRQFQSVLHSERLDAITGQITHIGGHKFAGNVILYLPPSLENPLAGKSIWYGRVEPRHCEGIVKETILGGRVVDELYRGSMAGAEP